MNEDIWANSQPGGLEDLEPAQPRSPLLDAKVMMVDDEPLMTDLIQAYLEDAGYVNFVVTNNALEALELLRREDPGVLLLDLMMPHLSGFELLQQIRADHQLRYTPVIVLTAATDAGSKLRALQLGVTDFLSKPVDESELVLRVRNTLAFHQYHNRISNFDAVTRLPNQRLFDRGIDEMVARRMLVGGMVALFSINVPECQLLRQSIDQASADRLAKAIARRLERFASAAHTGSAQATSNERAPRVARLGSARFGLVLEGLADGEAVQAMAQQVLAVLSEPVALGLHEVGPKPWIGIAVAPADGVNAETLRKGADLAATHGRQQGVVQFQFASPELNARSYEKLTLGLQLRGAAQRGELRLHYQPKVDLASNRIVGAEALVRWQHPDRGLVPPGQFIALAEEIGLIGTIGDWVLERACQDASEWAREGLGEIKIAVNVAKPQFLTGDLCGALRQVLAHSGLQASQLVIELTESMLMNDVSTSLALMHQLKALGVALSIDDFGTGYSSLSYLKRFPVDELKIDRSFVMDLPGGKTDIAIARTVIDLGHSLDMSVTAEGVETTGQLDCLTQLGCDIYQGFLFSRPVPTAEFTALLARSIASG
jgi:EAL domain-containing protein (putative c-di-GMP-specific phosphodiesterase class I)/PleD family two-component response regulator